MDSRESYARLQEEQAKALRVSREQIERWEQFHKDYEIVQQLLQSLPGRLTHDVIVPFGRFAFLPGQIYHTNEILVLLGDNWFAECSAQHASSIAQRRAEYVKSMLENECKQYGDLEARLHYTEELRSSAEEHAETREIREELTPAEQEKYSQPKRRIQWKGKSLPPQRVSPWSAAEEGRAGEDGARGGRAELWARLDELEREEEVFLREEEEKEEERAARGGWRRAGTGVVAGAANRRSSEQPLSGKLSRGAEGRRDGDPAPASITFTHSHDDAGREEEEEERRKFQAGSSPPLFVCPADIAPQAPPTLPSPPAATKSVTWDPDLKPESMMVPHPPTTPTSARPSGGQPTVAFSGSVVERGGTRETQEAPAVEESCQKVSRFKASRRK